MIEYFIEIIKNKTPSFINLHLIKLLEHVKNSSLIHSSENFNRRQENNDELF